MPNFPIPLLGLKALLRSRCSIAFLKIETFFQNVSLPLSQADNKQIKWKKQEVWIVLCSLPLKNMEMTSLACVILWNVII